jgi:hypothetical protein
LVAYIATDGDGHKGETTRRSQDVVELSGLLSNPAFGEQLRERTRSWHLV